MQSIFKRYEKKYLITQEQGTILQKLIAQNMVIDQLGDYLVQNLYYDTANWDIIRESIEKPMYKEKLRLRFYGQYNPKSQGFLELKKKFKGVVCKRRISFPLSELKKHSVREIVAADNSQISRELDFFLQNNPVSEKIYIAYKRIAYTHLGDNDLRITFDKDIYFHPAPLDNYNPAYGCQIIDQNQMLMEIKTTGAIPIWLARMLSEKHIFPVSFSKVGVCYTRFVFKRQDLEEDMNVA